MESDPVSGIVQECLARRRRLEDAEFPLLAEVFVDATRLGNKAGGTLGETSVEIFADHVPHYCRRRRIKQVSRERDEICLRTGIADRARTSLVATSKAAISAFMPWRTYSNSRRSTCPDFIGRLGAARSSAWMLVISSMEMVRTPCSAAAGAAR